MNIDQMIECLRIIERDPKPRDVAFLASTLRMMLQGDRELLTGAIGPGRAAIICGVAPNTIRKYVREGWLPVMARTPSGRMLLNEDAVRQFAEKRPRTLSRTNGRTSPTYGIE